MTSLGHVSKETVAVTTGTTAPNGINQPTNQKSKKKHVTGDKHGNVTSGFSVCI